MKAGELGRLYSDGEIIIREGDPGDRMYVIQSGRVILTRTSSEGEVVIGELGKEDIFGEMALFDHHVRSATARAAGPVRILSVDRKIFLKRVHDDPSLAFRVLQQMSRRLRAIDAHLTQLKANSPQGAEFSSDGLQADPRPSFMDALLHRVGRGATSADRTTKKALRPRGSDRRNRERRVNERRNTDRRGRERRDGKQA